MYLEAGLLCRSVPLLLWMTLLFSLCNGLATTEEAVCNPTVQLRRHGDKVEGNCTASARVFLGIPYAGSVSGNNRWKEAGPPDPWTGVRLAQEDPPACPQKCSSTTCNQAEDCLFLNVYTPRDATECSKYPVMVFIHGGSFLIGQGAAYNGSYLALTSRIVVVTINYRLGALGFLVFGYGDNAAKGNLGIKDQALALQWVQDNIAAFGGDKDKVTVSGESAGAMSIAVHMTRIGGYNPPLFHQAILESELFGVNYFHIDDERFHRLSTVFGLSLGCFTINCLRSKSYEAILQAQNSVLLAALLGFELSNPSFQWAPVLDDIVLDQQPLEAFRRGDFQKIPTIIGTTMAEGDLLVYGLYSSTLTASHYRRVMMSVFGINKAWKLFQVYGYGSDVADNRPLLASILTDYIFYCPTVLASKASATCNPVYSFIFDQPWPEEAPAICRVQACHVAEIPFVFHELTKLPALASLVEFSANVSMYWGSFVNTGNPNTPGEVSWPPNPQLNHFLDLNMTAAGSFVVEDYHKVYCDQLEKIGYESPPEDFSSAVHAVFAEHALEEEIYPPSKK